MSHEPGDRRKPRRWVAALPYLVPVLVLLFFRLTVPVSLCDDAYITFRTAENLSQGNGLVFNPGEPVFGITTPLWAILLAAVRNLGPDIPSAAKALSFLFEAGLLLCLVHLGKTIGTKTAVGFFAAVFLLTNPVFLLTSFSGMETALYLFLITASFLLLEQRRFGAALALASLGPWCRFDGFLLLAVILLSILFTAKGRLPMGTFLLPFFFTAGYFLFTLASFGDTIPMSVRRKLLSPATLQGVGKVANQFFLAPLGYSSYWYTARSYGWIALPLAGMGTALLWKKKCRAVSPLLVFLLLYCGLFIASGRKYAVNFPWYFVPPLIFYCLAAGMGAAYLFHLLAGYLSLRGPARAAAAFLAAAGWCVLMAFPIFQNAERIKKEIVSQREQVYGALSVWLSQRLTPPATIAAHEIGAAGFFAGPGITIFDLFGIIRKPGEEGRYTAVLKKHPPEAVITKDFYYKRSIERELHGLYHPCLAFRGCWVWIRKDLDMEKFRRLGSLESLYQHFRLQRKLQYAPEGSAEKKEKPL